MADQVTVYEAYQYSTESAASLKQHLNTKEFGVISTTTSLEVLQRAKEVVWFPTTRSTISNQELISIRNSIKELKEDLEAKSVVLENKILAASLRKITSTLQVVYSSNSDACRQIEETAVGLENGAIVPSEGLFKISLFCRTKFGESLNVIGDSDFLGGWDVTKVIKLKTGRMKKY